MSGQNTKEMTVSQKHDLIIQFNQQREASYDVYQQTK